MVFPGSLVISKLLRHSRKVGNSRGFKCHVWLKIGLCTCTEFGISNLHLGDISRAMCGLVPWGVANSPS